MCWTWSEDINFDERWVRLGTHKTADGSASFEKLWMNDDLYELLIGVWRARNLPAPMFSLITINRTPREITGGESRGRTACCRNYAG